MLAVVDMLAAGDGAAAAAGDGPAAASTVAGDGPAAAAGDGPAAAAGDGPAAAAGDVQSAPQQYRAVLDPRLSNALLEPVKDNQAPPHNVRLKPLS